MFFQAIATVNYFEKRIYIYIYNRIFFKIQNILKLSNFKSNQSKLFFLSSFNLPKCIPMHEGIQMFHKHCVRGLLLPGLTTLNLQPMHKSPSVSDVKFRRHIQTPNSDVKCRRQIQTSNSDVKFAFGMSAPQ